jgi:hypothetical protein
LISGGVSETMLRGKSRGRQRGFRRQGQNQAEGKLPHYREVAISADHRFP